MFGCFTGGLDLHVLLELTSSGRGEEAAALLQQEAHERGHAQAVLLRVLQSCCRGAQGVNGPQVHNWTGRPEPISALIRIAMAQDLLICPAELVQQVSRLRSLGEKTLL